MADFKVINQELASYSKVLAKKDQVVAFSKVDASIPEFIDEAKKQFKKYKPLFISAVSGEGIQVLLYKLKDEVLALRKKEREAANSSQLAGNSSQHKVFRPHLEISDTKNYTVEKTDEGFKVSGKRIEQLAIMTDMTKKGGIYRMHDILNKIGAYREMKRLGGQDGDKIQVGVREFVFMDMD